MEIVMIVRSIAGFLAALIATAAAAFSPGPYFPLPDGATWTFSSSLGGTMTETASSGTFFGTPVKVLREDSGDESYFTNDSQGIRLQGQYLIDPSGNETDQFVPPVPFAAADATIGTVVQGSGTLSASANGSTYLIAYTSTATPLAIETLTVLAGTFQNAVHLQVVLNLSFMGYSWYQTIDAWIVQGIGTVKRVNYDSGISALGIAPSSETLQLTTYNVPDIVPDAFSFVPKTVPAYLLATSGPITVSGIDAASPISVSGGQYSINGGTSTSSPGTVNSGDQVTVSLYAPAPGGSSTVTLTIGGVSGTFTVNVLADTTPNPFSFVPADGVPPGVAIVSNQIAVSGTDAAAPISVGGGEYSVSGQPFTSVAGTVCQGCSVRVRVTSSTTPGATVSATLNIGGVTGSFSATTAVASPAPRTLLYYASQAGDWVGAGETRIFAVPQTPISGVTTAITALRNSGNSAQFAMNQTVDGQSGDWFTLLIAARNGTILVPGRYEAASWPSSDSNPGLNFFGDGRGCGAITGRFDVLEALYADNGDVVRFAANFEQHCEGGITALFGQLRFNSSVPLGSNALVGRKADFAGDGKSDVLWRNMGAGGTGQNYVYPMDGRTILGGEGYLRTVADLNWQIAGVGDFDGDGKADILWRNGSTGQNYIYFMNGTSILGTEGYIRTVADLNWKVAGIGDFNGDGKDDILWRNSSTGENYLYPMDGRTILGTEGYLRTVADQNWQVAGVGDFNGDGKADILWRNSATGENYLYPMDGRTILGTEGYLRTVADQNWQVKGVGDFDGDGRADIVWRNSSTGENYLYPMNGTTILGTEGYLRTVADQAWQIAAVGDYDGDGKSDLLWRNSSTGQNYLYPMNGTAILPSEGYLRTVADQHWQVQSR